MCEARMNATNKFTASLVFRYRILDNESPNHDAEIVEKRLFTCTAESESSAEGYFNSRGRECEDSYFNVSGKQVQYQFLGIQEIQQHDSTVFEEDEIWLEVLNSHDIEINDLKVDLR